MNMPPQDKNLKPRPPAPPPKPGPILGGTLGIIAIAVSVGVIAGYTLDLHSHQCSSCGHKWWHLGAFNQGSEPAHRCRCGTVEWWKSGVPAAVRQAHGDDSWLKFMGEAFESGSTPIVSADSTVLVPSRHRP